MKAYNYKDSGIEWLGEIPSHWKADRIKDKTLSLVGGDWGNDPDSKDEGDPVIILRVADLDGINFSSSNLTIRKIKESSYESRKVTDKSLIIEKSGGGEKQLVGRVGNPSSIKTNAICSNFMANITFDNTVDINFMSYMFSCLYNAKLQFSFIQQTTGIQNLNVNYYLTRYIAIPPLSEQKVIVNYLDKAIDRVDRIIGIKQEQIESLDSYFTKELTKVITRGIGENKLQCTSCFWLPKIKDDWRLLPLKRLLKTKLKYGANEAAVDENVDDPRYIRITDFDRNGKLRKNTFRSLSPEVAAPYLLTEGDVLFARSGATVGKTFIFKDYDGLACFAGYLIKAECDKNKLLPDFLYYFTKSLSYSEWKDLIFTQATIQNIGADKYQYLNVPVPSVEEQNKIVEFIKILEEATNNAKSNINSQIETLQSYRKSLIHECVTGKKQVTDRIE